jgi:type II secretory pathway pseudopilin PulG
MLPQPPPDAPAPPPSEEALRSRRWWSWIWKTGTVSILIFLLSVLSAPLFLRARKKPNQTEAVNNIRQIGLALEEFQEEYGKFPDATTIVPVQNETGSLLPMGTTTSNDFFRQLFASGMTQSEAMFYARIDGTRIPDGRCDGSDALEKRECGFTYFLGATKSDNPRRPLVVTPMIPGTDRFDPKRFDGRAVILRMDNSVSSPTIDKAGHVFVDGRNLMDPHHPIWDGHAPVIAWPDL